MTSREIFHTILLLALAVVALCNVKGTQAPRKYINLAIGILLLGIVAYDICVAVGG